MSRLTYEFANFLVASWRLAQPGRNLPVGHQRIDRGMEAVERYLPDRFKGFLLFGDSVIGRICHTVPEILQAAAESYLLQPISPNYLEDRVLIDASRAMDMLENLGIDVQQGKAFGVNLADAIDRQHRRERDQQ